MISMILLMYVGTQIDAPMWYYALIIVCCLFKILSTGFKIGKEVAAPSE